MEQHSKKCRGCGGVIEKDDDAVQVTMGKLRKKYKENSTWGYMHAGCFLVAVGDPNAIFHVQASNAA